MPNKIFNLSLEPSLANRFVAQLRDVNIQKDSMRFRRNLERIGEIMAYEISKTLTYEPIDVETPLGIAKEQLCQQKIVLATILRAGVPLHQGLLNYFDDAENAFVSAYRMHHKSGDFDINLEYITCPDLNNKILIVADPMLATGASMELAINALLEYGIPAQIHVVTAIASSQGASYIRRTQPKVHLWTGAIDEELTAKSYIVPGLGDAGDLSYGPKMQQ